MPNGTPESNKQQRDDGPGGTARLAYQRIRAAIVEGQYRPGQRLTELGVAERLDLSRTPVREALQRLSAEGLVITRPNRGAIVRPITAQWIKDLYEFRACFEAYAAKRAATYASEPDVIDLSDAITAFEDAIPTAADGSIQGIRELSSCNNTFHATIVRASRHSQLETVLAHTVDLPLVFQAFRQYTTEEHLRSNMFHRLIRDAIAKGEGERAAGAMTEHIYLGRDRLLADIDRADRVAPLLNVTQTRARRNGDR